MTTLKFQPKNDNVLIKMDVQRRSSTIITPDSAGGDQPTVLPSGTVLAVGRGVFIPGTGFVGAQCKVGDHVAVSMEGSWSNLPLSEDKNEVFIACSESLILGTIEGLTPDHRWYSKANEDRVAPRLVR